jgi:cellulose synthase/poly-beta-1,6-N-acetylglucosamine synthase-like glycosyltransferase
METAFWVSALFIAYVYVGYPALLALWVRGSGFRVRGSGFGVQADNHPTVSVIVAARNEARRLPSRIQNLLSLDYPADRVEIIVVSDGSTDDTLASMAPFADRIKVVAAPALGKAAALNAGVARAAHEILVFADARQTFAHDALARLTAPFADRRVGGVTGELVLGCESSSGRRAGTDRREGRPNAPIDRRSAARGDGGRRTAERRGHFTSTVADGVGLYWRYEKSLRRLESAVGSTLGATGAIYALRRTLWQPLPEGTILDDVLAPMRAVLAGQRVIFEERAQAFDHTPADSDTEGRRKIRTLAGNFQILWQEPRLLMPVVNPVWIQYISHKVGRLLVPYALIVLLASSIALAPHPLYGTALFAQCTFYLLSGYGAWLEMRAANA